MGDATTPTPPPAAADSAALAATMVDLGREGNGPTHDLLPLPEISSLAVASSQTEVEVDVGPDVRGDKREGGRLIQAEVPTLRRCDCCCCSRDARGDRGGAWWGRVGLGGVLLLLLKEMLYETRVGWSGVGWCRVMMTFSP